MTSVPDSLLFVCGENALRSPMAEAMVKRDYGDRVYVDSVGLREGVLDALAVAVMGEMGIDITGHMAKRFDHMANSSFDMIVTLTPEAHCRALEAARASACEVVYWDVDDPSLVEGSRDTRLGAYREVRNGLRARIGDLFDNGSPCG